MSTPSQSASSAATPRAIITAGLASTVAWSFDLFDLFILLYVASTIGPLFFPTDSPTLTLAATFGAFAVTLVMRPAGAAIFGPFADKHGRRRAMVVAVLGVGIATALLGVLPTYATVGLFAPIAFLLVRMVQGIFVGGVVASTHTLATETVPEKYRGLMSGTVAGGAGIGSLLASLGYLLVAGLFPGDAFSTVGWRVMFGLGLLGSLLSLLILKWVEESPVWQQQADRRSAIDPSRPVTKEKALRNLWSGHRKTLLLNLLIVIGAGTQYYLTSGLLPSILDVVNKIPKQEAAEILSLASLAVVAGPMAAGQLSEWIGRRWTFIVVGVANLIFIPIGYWQLAQADADETGRILGYVLLLSFLGNIGLGHIIIFLNERYPTNVRSSGTALGWNLGFAIGGIMPTFVALSSSTVEDMPLRAVQFILAGTVVYLVVAILVPETKGGIERWAASDSAKAKAKARSSDDAGDRTGRPH